ncbi:hypothetical protein BDW22DRAFT_1355366 [Trametopsis cervina]|nr:hypothetical protein BDW22DRAFT_1355366 [Trametopsis cervina]
MAGFNTDKDAQTIARSESQSSSASSKSSKSSLSFVFNRTAPHIIPNLFSQGSNSKSQPAAVAQMLDDDNQAWGKPR